MAKINDLPLLSNPTEDMYCLVGKEDLQKVPWSAIMGQIGAPYIATTVAGMTDKTRVYVYQGSESGYTSGNWYYWNGSAWTPSGTYNSAAVDTDKTLTQSDKPADSAIVGKKIGSLKESLSNKITKFYASNQGETHITDSDSGKIQDMMIYGKSEQKQYKGINLLPPDTKPKEYVEVSIPKGSAVFLATDGTLSNGGSLKFFNEDKTKSMWIGIDSGTTSSKQSLTIDAKYVQNHLNASFDLSKICLGVGSEPIYEPYTGGIPSPSPDYPQEIKSVVNPTVKVTNEDGLKVQSVTLNNITLNAIPVSSGGNVTIDGQQYIADYVDVERGKVVRKCERKTLNTKNGKIDEEYRLAINIAPTAYNDGSRECVFSTFKWSNWGTCAAGRTIYIKEIKKPNNELYTAQELKELSLDFDVVYQLLEQQETDLTAEQTQAFKALATYYPTTNISANSEQLDGYTVFNYPISMANGWNYVKQQLNDNRNYIYDMDLQSAEAYVNSEYAVALTELEV